MYVITATLPVIGKAYYSGRNEHGRPKWLASGRVVRYKTLGDALPELNRLTEEALASGTTGMGITIEELPEEGRFNWKDTLGSVAFVSVLMGAAGLAGAVETRRPVVTAAVVLAAGVLLFLACRPVTAQAAGIEVPKTIIEMSEEIGAEYGICPEILQAIAFKESSFDPEAVNGSCIGLMQINEPYHRERMERLGVTDLCDPRQSMRVAADYLAELAEGYGDIGIVLMAYNGFRDAEEYVIRTEELSEYAESVLVLSAELERAHGK